MVDAVLPMANFWNKLVLQWNAGCLIAIFCINECEQNLGAEDNMSCFVTS